MASINDVIEAFWQAPTNVDRGTLFKTCAGPRFK
jgi:hypothetical protein